MKTPYPYQKECLDAIWYNIKEHVLVSLPTGTGKSLVQAYFIKDALKYQDTKIVVAVPSKELVQQNYDELKENFPEVNASIYCAGLKNKDATGDVVIGTIHSLINADFDKIDIVIIDEVHLLPHRQEGRYHDFLAFYPNARVVGLTATPYRLSGGYLYDNNEIFTTLHYEAKIKDMIKQNYLSPVISSGAKKEIDTSNIKKTAGEYNKKSLEEAFITQDVTSFAVQDFTYKAMNRKHILIFACGIEHANLIYKILSNSEVLTGKSKDREEIIQRFKDGKTRYLINVGVLTTGFNFPALDCIVLLRSTLSTSLFIQMVGRGTRIFPNKDNCLLLDYGKNVETHGTIDNVFPIIMGARKSKRAWKCDVCSTHNPYTTLECSQCDFVREKIERNSAGNIEAFCYNGEVISGRDEVQAIDVVSMRCFKHISRAGNDCIKVSYKTNNIAGDVINEYIFPEGNGMLRNRFKEFCVLHGIMPTSDTDQFFEIKDELITPKVLIYKRDGNFKNIVDKLF